MNTAINLDIIERLSSFNVNGKL